MSIPQTQSSDMKVWEDQQWEVKAPLGIPVIAVETPALFADLRSVELEEAMPSDFTLVWSRHERNIDTVAHQSLLEESLREYGDIWRKLAEK
jgi:hypothetical protein